MPEQTPAFDDGLIACLPIDPLPNPQLLERLRERIDHLKERTIFLVHYYQPTWIKRLLTDCGAEVVIADSQQLAQRGHDSTHDLLFCVTVPFMAGSSAILSKPEQQVVLADEEQGCTLEEAAPPELVTAMLQRLERLQRRYVPVCYTNVGAEVKAITGDSGGIIHTSSNAVSAFDWAAERGVPVFLPDQHLAANVAAEKGIERVAYWRQTEPGAGVTDGELEAAQLVIWTGECSVHVAADSEVIARFAAQYPQAWLVLHPEVPNIHVRAALAAAPGRVGLGSTMFIRSKLREIAEQGPGGVVGIATETNFVAELKEEFEGQVQVFNLLRDVCACAHMRTRPDKLLAALDDAVGGELSSSPHLVKLDPSVREGAKKALARSLELVSAPFGLRW